MLFIKIPVTQVTKVSVNPHTLWKSDSDIAYAILPVIRVMISLIEVSINHISRLPEVLFLNLLNKS